jgi:ribonuclease HI
VFLDIVGAFNDCWPDAIAYRLLERKAPPCYVKLVRSYLNDRVGQIQTPDGLVQQHLTKSCPQGGVLSPFLYSLFIDDFLTNQKLQSDLRQGFADDLALGVQGRNRNKLEQRMNRLLYRANEWAKKWKIEFSTAKTIAVLFSHSRKSRMINLFLNGCQIEVRSEFRYLGILFDSKLHWKQHIIQQCAKANALLLKLKAVTKKKWGLPQKTNLFIYKRVIEPILLYGCAVWSKSLEKASLVSLLRRSQRLAALAITGALRTTSTDALFVLSGLKPIDLTASERSAMEFIRITENQKLSDMLDAQNQLYIHESSPIHNSSLQYIQSCAMKLASYNLGSQRETIPTPPPWEVHNNIVILDEPCGSVFYNDSNYTYYTDASQQTIGAPIGIGVVLQQSLETFVEISMTKLPGCASVFQGELAAISEALQHAQDIELCNTSISIFSDSRSSLLMLQQSDPGLPLARVIKNQICDLYSKHCTIKLLWVKGHSGIMGNESADALAKRACTEGRPLSGSTIQIMSSQFYKSRIRGKTDEIWQSIWNSSSKGRLTFGICPKISNIDALQDLVKSLNNHSRSLIFQAMSGHIPLNDYLCRFRLQADEACHSCHASKEDITHLLTTCSRYSYLRFRFLTPKEIHESQMNLADYFKPWSLPLTLEILNIRFST